MSKGYKLENLEQALLNLPEEERAEAREMIKEMFADFDPANPPGQALLRLETDTRDCPQCGGKLVEVTVIGGTDGQPRELVLDCTECDEAFIREAESC